MLGIQLNTTRFLSLLSKLIGVTERLQNNPPEHVPQEDLVGDFVLETMKPFLAENGGPLKVQRINYAPKRNNIIIEYPGMLTSAPGPPLSEKPRPSLRPSADASLGKTSKFVSFVGSHMDVVPANRAEWTRDPFSLTVEGDLLFGRGTTDCLGHVALLTDFFCQLAEKRPSLNIGVAAVFICNEENSEVEDIGVDGLMKEGKIDHLKSGPVYWVDSADKQPCVGTGSVAVWKLKAIGKPGHSGLPQSCINPILLAKDALQFLIDKFHKDFPAHASEAKYGFQSPSSLKPTAWETPTGGHNQIRPEAVITGDIRATPFYKMEEIQKAVEGYIREFNQKLHTLPTLAFMAHQLPDGTRGKVTLEWLGGVNNGIACSLESEGFKALAKASQDVLGKCVPYSVTGSLPLVHEMQQAGYDIQIVGYGDENAYHAPNEWATLSGMQEGARIFSQIVDIINAGSTK